MLKTKFIHTFYLCSSCLLIAVSFAVSPAPTAAFSLAKEEPAEQQINTHLLTVADIHSSRKFVKFPSIEAEMKINKQEMLFVKKYIQSSSDCLDSINERSADPFCIIDSVFNHYGLPVELKYLAVIESELKPSALSQVGARGPWQFMPATAHDLGLKISSRYDERTDYYKSTTAAAKYLRDLYVQFGDWLLVIAAYNGGPKPVYAAIRESGSRNFWVLQPYLPAESREHVKRFIATNYYFENHVSASIAQQSINIVPKKKFISLTNSHRVSQGPNDKYRKAGNRHVASSVGNLAISRLRKHKSGSLAIKKDHALHKNHNIASQFRITDQKSRGAMKES